MTKETPHRSSKGKPIRPTAAASVVLDSGEIVEMILRRDERRTVFLVADASGAIEERDQVLTDKGERLVPFSPDNNLLEHDVVLLPSGVDDYGNESELLDDIRKFIHRYVEVSPIFEEIASYYVLLTWVYDAFNELPYLRVRGDFGSGKSRFLLTVGSICYKPMFASGASTVSPVFRILDSFRGTLIVDEADFRMSDQQAEIVKILNNGNARGFPVLRTEVTARKEFEPRAYSVFGPKIVATRDFFEDRALESRFLTEEMTGQRPRKDIPLNLPDEQKEEALAIRNKLLLFRFRNLHRSRDLTVLADRSIEPRLSQIFAPLLAIVRDPVSSDSLRTLARRYHEELQTDRSMATEAQLLEVIRELRMLSSEPIAIKDIAGRFATRFGDDYDRRISPKWIGSLIRRKLHLRPRKIRGVFVINASEFKDISRLYERYGINPSTESGAAANA